MSQDGNGRYNGEYPETEVAPKARRRQYSREYKQRIVAEIDGCEKQSDKSAILRREGLYSTLVSKWREQVQRNGPDGLGPRKRGPKRRPEVGDLERLQDENDRLRRQLEQAQMIIEVQKKVSLLLNVALDEQQSGRR
jgi:transposase-like protein